VTFIFCLLKIKVFQQVGVPEQADTDTSQFQSKLPEPSTQSLPIHTGRAAASSLFSNLGPFNLGSSSQSTTSISQTGGLFSASSPKVTKSVPKVDGLFRFPSPQITPALGSGGKSNASKSKAAPLTSPSNYLFGSRTAKAAPATLISSGQSDASTAGSFARSVQGKPTSTETTPQSAPQWSFGQPISKAPLDGATAPPNASPPAIIWPKSEPGTIKEGTRELPPSTFGRSFSCFTEKDNFEDKTNEFQTIAANPLLIKFSLEVCSPNS
jgi:hypothetical protein